MFEEVLFHSNTNQRRAIFAVLTLQGYTTKCIYDNLVLRRSMYLTNSTMNDEELNEELLEDLQNRIAVGGRSLAVYGLPAPLIKKSELDFHKMKYPKRASEICFQELCDKYPLNDEQYGVYNQIINAVMGQQKK